MILINTIAEKTFWQTFVDSQYYNPINLLQGIGAIATAGALIYAFKQNLSGKVQQFESTLFNLITLHNNIVGNLSYNVVKTDYIIDEVISDITYNGKGVFHGATKELRLALRVEFVREYVDDTSYITHEHPIIDIEQAKRVFKNQYYDRFYLSIESELNHYFRNLYHILKYIDQTSLINNIQKRFYAGILRAQLSQDELHLWVFNSMHKNYGYPNGLYLIKKYDMMQNFGNGNIKPKIWWEYFNYLKTSVKKPKDWS